MAQHVTFDIDILVVFYIGKHRKILQEVRIFLTSDSINSMSKDHRDLQFVYSLGGRLLISTKFYSWKCQFSKFERQNLEFGGQIEKKMFKKTQ